LWEICLCYLDDIIIFGRTPQELLDRMRTILDKLHEVGLKVKPSKCVLFKTEIQYLGYLVSEAGINPMPDKIGLGYSKVFDGRKSLPWPCFILSEIRTRLRHYC